MNERPILEADLQAYVDGLLPQTRQFEIQFYLSTRPQESERLKAYRKQKDNLRALFNSVLLEPIPPEMLQPPRHWNPGIQRYAASLVIAIASRVLGWILHEQAHIEGFGRFPAVTLESDRSMASFVKHAAIAHAVYGPDIRHPVEITADQEEQLVTWISKGLGSKVNPPELGKLGYELIGGRLLPGEEGPVAQFMYRDSHGERLTLYVSNERNQDKDSGFRFAQEGPVNVFYWIDGKFGYALSAGVTRDELKRIADVVYEQLGKS